MPVDSMHATIEREIQKLTVWSPSQWMPYISAARKRPRPYQVNVMEHNDFMNWEEISAKTFTKETLKKIKLKQIRIATFKKKSTNQVEIKYTMDETVIAEKITLAEEPTKKQKGKGKLRMKGKARIESLKNENTDDSGVEEGQPKTIVLRNLYDARSPISTVKYNDLKRLCEKDIIPKPFQHEFLSLPHNVSLKDHLIDTDEDNVKTDDEQLAELIA